MVRQVILQLRIGFHHEESLLHLDLPYLLKLYYFHVEKKKEHLILFSYHKPYSHLFIRNKPAIMCKNIKLGNTGVIIFCAFVEFD